MQSKAATVEQYLASLPEDRRHAISVVRKTILDNLDKDYGEGMQYGMIGYFVPHSVFPAGYHCDPKQPVPFASIASQKNHMAVYLMGVYGDPALEKWFREAWAKTGKKLDLGKACLRFKKLDDVALDVLGEVIRRVPAKAYLERYQAVLGGAGKAPAKAKTAKPASTSASAKKPAAAKTASAKKPAAKKKQTSARA